MRGLITNTSQLSFDRDRLGNGEVHLTWFLIQFTDDTRTQHGNVSFDTSSTSSSLTLPQQVDPSCALPLVGYHQRGGKSSSTSDHASSGWFRAYFDATGSELNFERGMTNSSTADAGWFVLEFPGCDLDHGDAPATYGNVSHALLDSSIYLGSIAPDDDPSDNSSANADGDDSVGSDDEDGITPPVTAWMTGSSEALSVDIQGTGFLNAWIDWNLDGDFDDAGEQISNEVAVSTGNRQSDNSSPCQCFKR